MLVELEPRLIHAPELYGAGWLNDGPVSIRDNIGRVILLDFWDYTCVNCLRSLPYVYAWSATYQPYGMVTVGVHTPEFKFASDEQNVRAASERLSIDYPVVLDNEEVIWGAYAVRAWPTRILIDKNGYVRFRQQGEGNYQEFERAIQVLLRDAGHRGELPMLLDPLREEDMPGAVCHRPTAELHAGYVRGALGNTEGYAPEATAAFEDPGLYIAGRFYVEGPWWSARDHMRFDGGSGTQGSVHATYEAREVNGVLGSADGRPVEIVVEQDGEPVPAASLGSDVRIAPDGRTVCTVTEPRMYSLIRNPMYGGHDLKLRLTAPGLELYSFSFVTAVMVSPFYSN